MFPITGLHRSHPESLICSLPSYQALYSYVPQNDDELELQEGDLVSVMEKCDDGWFVGACHISLDRFPTGVCM